MKIIPIEVGNLGTNCYIVFDEISKEALILDPGGSAVRIMAEIGNNQLKVKYIVNTHGHADHVLDNLKVKEKSGALLLIHEADSDMLISPQKNLSAFIGGAAVCGPADKLLKDGDEIKIGDIKFTILHTPGHTPGGICLLSGDILFSGDTLFAESIGRTDFPGGSYRQLLDSIREKLLPLHDEVKVYPGHGAETTIGWERRMNPFIQQ